MFDKSLFTYYPDTHLGFYDGKLVPSTTQLIECLYPLDPNIKQEVLKKAGERGTAIHNTVEDFNDFYIKEQKLKSVDDGDIQELKDYYSLLMTYDLRPLYAEQIVFLLDDKGELICYGHYDFVLECIKSNELFNCLDTYLFDLKTTSTFDKKKTKLQTQIYRVACNQLGLDLNGKTFGIWLRDGNANIYPFEEVEDSQVIKLCAGLRKIWESKQDNGKDTN